MCGIAGVLTADGVARHLPALAAMSERQRRRGPDADAAYDDGSSAAFAFRRLAVIDTSPAGDQPMRSACGRHVLMLNGEIYNFRALRRTLEADGVRFRSTSDAEVALQAFVRWGKDALARLDGMFALAYYDTREKSLLLARDPLGIKPLYYLVAPGLLVFASQFDALLLHPACARTPLRDDALALYLRLGYIPAPLALFANTHQLAAGSRLIARPETPPHVERYYELPAPRPLLSGDAAVDSTLEAVRGAVGRQLVSDVALGCFLSGGIDSSLITAIACAQRPGLPALSIGSDDPRLDETAAAAATAAHLDVAHRTRRFSEADCRAWLDRVVDAFGEPFADDSAFPSLLLAAEARADVTVALSGDGGDELFWGYPRFRKLLGARTDFLAPHWQRSARYAWSRLVGRGHVARGVTAASLDVWYLDAHSGLTHAELRQLAPGAAAPATFPSPAPLAPVDDACALALWLRQMELSFHLQMMLTKVDRASMYHGLEVRVPLLDLEVVACALQLEPSSCLAPDGMDKAVLRTALARVVPGVDTRAPKRGFDVPMSTWLRGPLRAFAEDVLLRGDLYPAGRLARSAVARLWEQHQWHGLDRSRALWTLLALQLWARHHLARPAVALSERRSIEVGPR